MAIPFTEEDFNEPSLSSGQPPDDIIEQMAQVREEQARSLQEHIQYRQGLEQKQQEVDLRSGDLDVSERLLRVFDTTLPKPFREFELRGLSRHLGIDPKGDNFKDISKVVMGLDPDSSMAVKEAFTARIADATPGQISEFTRGILQGKVPISQLAGMVREHQVAQAGSMTDATGGPSQQDKIEGLFSRQDSEFKPQDVMRQQQNAGRFASPGIASRDQVNQSVDVSMEEDAPDRIPIPEMEYEVDYNDTRVVEPGMAAALGYDPRQSSSAEILAKHPGIDIEDKTERRKLLEELAGSRMYTKRAHALAGQIIADLDAHPTAVSYTVPIVGEFLKKWGIGGGEINLAQLETGWKDWISKQQTSMPEDVDPETRAAAQAATRIGSNILALAYSSAKSRDAAGRIAVDDIQNEYRGLAKDYGSADLFKVGVRQYIHNIVAEHYDRVMVKTGGPPAAIEESKPVILDRRKQQSIPTEQSAPAEQSAPTGQTQTPTQQTPTKPTEGKTPVDQAQDRRGREEAKQADEEVQQARRRFELEQAPKDAQLRLEAANRDVERLELAKQAAKEQKDWREYQKLRDQQREAQRQRDKIAAAFAQFARAMASAVRGFSHGGTPSMGPDQDANAFKIQMRQRGVAPPTPAPAQSGYTYTRKRREMER